MPKQPRLNSNLIKRACGAGDKDAIAELSNTLTANCRERETYVKQGKAQLVSLGNFLADSVIQNFAYRMLRACEQAGYSPPHELVDLFQTVMKQDRPPARSDRKYVPWLHALEYLETNPNAGVREIAREVGVYPSTVTRWRQSGKL